MNILVIGGAGYIGSHMCKLLFKNNHNVFILDNLSTGFKHLAKYGTFIEGDTSNDIDNILLDNKIEAVIHFAASSIVSESMSNPMKYYKNNVFNTINVLESMSRCNVDKIIFSSTAAIFGNPEYTPIDENHPKNPINPYGRSKLMVEEILSSLKINSVSLRYFNACGADSNGELGECHDPETHLIPIILQVANNKREKITIFGDNYNTPDGTCIRDYIHIEDLCKAHLLALDYINNKSGNFKFNLGNGNGYSVKEIITSIEKITGKTINFEIGDIREGDPAILIADSSLARMELNWEPKKSLDEIIKDAWNWELKKP